MKLGRTLRFAVTGALLAGSASACEDPVGPNEPRIPAEVSNNEPAPRPDPPPPDEDDVPVDVTDDAQPVDIDTNELAPDPE